MREAANQVLYTNMSLNYKETIIQDYAADVKQQMVIMVESQKKQTYDGYPKEYDTVVRG